MSASLPLSSAAAARGTMVAVDSLPLRRINHYMGGSGRLLERTGEVASRGRAVVLAAAPAAGVTRRSHHRCVTALPCSTAPHLVVWVGWGAKVRHGGDGGHLAGAARATHARAPLADVARRARLAASSAEISKVGDDDMVKGSCAGGASLLRLVAEAG